MHNPLHVHSGNQLVEDYIGTAYDNVKRVAESIGAIDAISGELTDLAAINAELTRLGMLSDNLDLLETLSGFAYSDIPEDGTLEFGKYYRIGTEDTVYLPDVVGNDGKFLFMYPESLDWLDMGTTEMNTVDGQTFGANQDIGSSQFIRIIADEANLNWVIDGDEPVATSVGGEEQLALIESLIGLENKEEVISLGEVPVGTSIIVQDPSGDKFPWEYVEDLSIPDSGDNEVNGLFIQTNPLGGFKRIYSGTVKPEWYNVSLSDTSNMQIFINDLVTTGAQGELSQGEYLLSEDLVVSYSTDIDDSFTLKGQGSGKNGTHLHFISGTLRLLHRNHTVSNLHVSSDDANGIEVTPTNLGSGDTNASRSSMTNVRSEDCEKSGIIFENCWLYRLDNCYFRYNKEYGIDGGDGTLLGCNSLVLISCEIQGNGTGDGTFKSLYGGFRVGRSVQTIVIGGAIEGNYSDGLIFTDQTVGFHSVGLYFEKNGRHEDDRDIIKDISSNVALRAYDITIENSNFTPQDYNGTAQSRAIEVADIEGFNVINPIFLARSGGIVYTDELIKVSESSAGITTGRVESPSNRSSSYTQSYLLNDTATFGVKTAQVVQLNLSCPTGVDTESARFTVPRNMTEDGNRIKATGMCIQETGSGGGSLTRQGAMRISFYKGTRNSASSINTSEVDFNSSINPFEFAHYTDAITWSGPSMQTSVARMGTDSIDTHAESIQIMAVEIERYIGVV